MCSQASSGSTKATQCQAVEVGTQRCPQALCTLQGFRHPKFVLRMPSSAERPADLCAETNSVKHGLIAWLSLMVQCTQVISLGAGCFSTALPHLVLLMPPLLAQWWGQAGRRQSAFLPSSPASWRLLRRGPASAWDRENAPASSLHLGWGHATGWVPIK